MVDRDWFESLVTFINIIWSSYASHRTGFGITLIATTYSRTKLEMSAMLFGVSPLATKPHK